ncbi:MAG TPA: M36 family metallopeptidase [Thermoanaerobaculia bacterium]|nr:M36 family metallopeptidase [Thermoanaerobaculia bacterium]
MRIRIGLFCLLFPSILFAAHRPPNYDAVADAPVVPHVSALAQIRAGIPVEWDTRFDVPSFVWMAGSQIADGAYVAHVHDTGRGAIIFKYRQRIDGIEVFRDELNVMLTRDHKVLATSGSLAPSFGVRRLAAAFVSEADAVATALKDLAPEADPADAQSWVHRVWFHLPDHLESAYSIVLDLADRSSTDSDMFLYVISATDGRLLFRKNLTEDDSPPFTYRVWADPQGVHRPMNGPQGFGGIPHPSGTNDGFQPPFVDPTLITLANGPISTQDPWLVSNAIQTTGNNADAYVDLSSPDGFSAGDFRAAVNSPNTFDYNYDLASAPSANRTQQMAAITQLFYNVNFFHDWYYDSGFNESAGNGQLDNYGRGGVGGDPLRAEAQDFSGRNNANMSTPPDGMRPRMQMYLWDGIGSRVLKVDSPSAIARDYGIGVADFGPSSFNISGDVVAVTPADGCSTISTPLSGKIAFIDRGTCGFAVKAQNAKTAGAIAVIVGNVPTSVSPGSFARMACSASPCPTAETTLPPSFHIPLADADAFRAQLANGPVHVTMQRDRATDRDGDLDNEVVAHEWGHYLSNRLISNSSGLTTQQSRGMGEGWSDFLALLLVARPEDAAVASNANFNGVYSAGQFVTGGGSNGPLPNGGYYFAVRRVPYSTDMTRDPLTLKHISRGNPITGVPTAFGADGSNNQEVHATGEVWATMLWECYASLLRDTLGVRPRLTFAEAQKRMKDYIVASLKMTPANPTFLEARDAVLAAAYASDMTDYREFWEAFAKRGAGIRALAADRYSTANLGTVEDFTVGADASIVAISIDDSMAMTCRSDGILEGGESGRLQVMLRNSGNARLQQTTGRLTSTDPRLTFDGILTFPSTEPGQIAVAEIPSILAKTSEIVLPTITVTVTDPAFVISSGATTLFQPRLNARDEAEQSATDDAESHRTAWKVSGSALQWHSLELGPRDHVWQATESLSPTDSSLVSPLLVVSRNRPLRFTFRQRYWFDIATDTSGNLQPLDGGVIEITTDDGETWSDIGAAASPSYGSATILSGNRNPLAGRRAFIGSSPGASLDDPQGSRFTTTTVELGSAYAGQRVRVRFRIGTGGIHTGLPLLGWQIDDVAFSGITNLPFFGLVADRGLCGSADSTTELRTGSPGTLEAVVSSATDIPNGTVDFLENGGVVASALLVKGKARWNAAADLPAGEHTITAAFVGSANFNASSSVPITISVTPPPRRRAAGHQ